MQPFRFAQRCRPGFPPGLSGSVQARVANRRLRRWLGICLIAIVAGWPAMLAGSSVAGPPASGPPASGPAYVLTAFAGPQARVINPGPPTGLTAAGGNAQVTLSWTAPASDGGAAIIDYDVYLGTGSGGESAAPAITVTGTSATVAGLTNGTTYYFTVDAVNDADLHSAPSAQASATPVLPVTAPGAPAGLTATAGDAQVSLSWTAPGSDGGAQVTSYDVYEGSTASVKLGTPVASPKGTSVTVKNLANGTTYYFEVTAVNQAGQGSASAAASATPALSITQPGAPTGLTATPGHDQVSLSWTAPASDGGAAISGYLIYRGTSPGAESATPVNGSPVSATSYTVTGLASGTTYYFKVAAINAAKHQGNDSGEVSATPTSATTSPSATASASAAASAGYPSATAGASAAAAGPTTSAHAQVSPSQTGILTAKKVPKPVIISLAAVAVGATAGALTLGVWRLRPQRLAPRSHPSPAPPSDVRAVPEMGPPGSVTIHEIGLDDSYTVRLEPLPGAIITTLEEVSS
jgi:predicted phage tail protein